MNQVVGLLHTATFLHLYLKTKAVNQVGNSNPWYKWLSLLKPQADFCLPGYLHLLTQVWTVPNVPGMVQPHSFCWDSFQFAKSTRLRQCRVREKQLRAQKRAALPKPYTSNTACPLARVHYQSKGIRKKFHVCSQVGTTEQAKWVQLACERRMACAGNKAGGISIGRLTALPLGSESHSHVQQWALSKEPSSWKCSALQAAVTVPENRPTVVNVNTISHCL